MEKRNNLIAFDLEFSELTKCPFIYGISIDRKQIDGKLKILKASSVEYLYRGLKQESRSQLSHYCISMLI